MINKANLSSRSERCFACEKKFLWSDSHQESSWSDKKATCLLLKLITLLALCVLKNLHEDSFCVLLFRVNCWLSEWRLKINALGTVCNFCHSFFELLLLFLKFLCPKNTKKPWNFSEKGVWPVSMTQHSNIALCCDFNVLLFFGTLNKIDNCNCFTNRMWSIVRGNRRNWRENDSS